MEVEKPTPSTVGDNKKKRPVADDPANDAGSKAAKIGLVAKDDIVLLGRKMQAQQNKLVSNIGITSSPSSKLLAVITNDVSSGKRKMEENGHKELFILSASVLQVMDPGYLNSPYEPAIHTPPKFRVFTNEEGKPKEGHKPVNLVKIQKASMTEGGPLIDVLTFQSYMEHPKTALRTKCRGEPTAIAGAFAGGGLPLNFMGYADACKISTFGSPDDRGGVDLLKQFSVVILSVKIKSEEKCKRGFGLALTAIEVLPEVDVSMCGLYSDYRMYTPFTAIGEQTEAFLNRKVFSQAFDSDVYFIRNFFRQSEKMDIVSEKPLVQMRPQELGKNTQVHVASNNAQLQLVIDNPETVYHGKTMEVHIADTAFSQRTRTTGLYWLQELYRYLIGAGVATVVVLHDDYRFRQTDSGRGLHCYVVPDWKALAPSQGGETITLTKQQMSALKEKKMGGIDVLATLPDGSARYSAWQVAQVSSTRYVVVADNSGAKFAKKIDGSESDSTRHTSPVCQVYPGMSPQRGVVMAYLVALSETDVISTLVASLKCMKDEECVDAKALSSMVAVPDDVVDVDSVFG